MTTLRLEGDGSGAVKALTDLNRAIETTDKNLDGAVLSAKKLEDAAGRIVKANEGPLEKYNRRVAELAQLVSRGKLSHDEAAKAVERYYHQLERAERTQRTGFGPDAVNRLSQMAAGWASVGSAVGLVKGVLDEVERSSQAAADSVINALGSAGELQQLGPDSFKRGAATARKLRRAGLITDLSQGFDIATNLENAGFSDEELAFIVNDLAKTRVVKAENLESVGGALTKFRTAFGAKEAGSLKEVLDKTLRVSALPGVQANLTQTVTESLKFADLFQSIGIGDEQTLAAFAGVEAVSPSRESASEALKSFAAQVDKRGLSKGDLFATLDSISAQVDKGGNAFDILGEQNAVIGFKRLRKQRETIKQNEALIRGAGGTLDSTAGLLQGDPSLRAADFSTRAQGELVSSQEEQFSEGESLFQGVRALRRKRIEQQSGEAMGALFDFFMGKVTDLNIGGSQDRLIADELKLNRQSGGGLLAPNDVKILEDYLRRTAEAGEGINRKAGARATARPEE